MLNQHDNWQSFFLVSVCVFLFDDRNLRRVKV